MTLRSLTVAVLLTLVVAGCGANRPNSRPPDSTAGEFSKKGCGSFCGNDTNQAAKRKLEGSDAWCRWNRKNVIVHVRLVNGFGARVRVDVTPKYEIENGGWHGNAYLSAQSIDLEPHAARSFRMNAGSPEGVPTGTHISKCAPTLDYIDVTN